MKQIAPGAERVHLQPRLRGSILCVSRSCSLVAVKKSALDHMYLSEQCTCLANSPSPLELQLPPANGAVGDTGLFFDGFLIASLLQQTFHAQPLVFRISLAHDNDFCDRRDCTESDKMGVVDNLLAGQES